VAPGGRVGGGWPVAGSRSPVPAEPARKAKQPPLGNPIGIPAQDFKSQFCPDHFAPINLPGTILPQPFCPDRFPCLRNGLSLRFKAF
jgi:hypothetical protein